MMGFHMQNVMLVLLLAVSSLQLSVMVKAAPLVRSERKVTLSPHSVPEAASHMPVEESGAGFIDTVAADDEGRSSRHGGAGRGKEAMAAPGSGGRGGVTAKTAQGGGSSSRWALFARAIVILCAAVIVVVQAVHWRLAKDKTAGDSITQEALGKAELERAARPVKISAKMAKEERFATYMSGLEQMATDALHSLVPGGNEDQKDPSLIAQNTIETKKAGVKGTAVAGRRPSEEAADGWSTTDGGGQSSNEVSGAVEAVIGGESTPSDEEQRTIVRQEPPLFGETPPQSALLPEKQGLFAATHLESDLLPESREEMALSAAVDDLLVPFEVKASSGEQPDDDDEPMAVPGGQLEKDHEDNNKRASFFGVAEGVEEEDVLDVGVSPVQDKDVLDVGASPVQEARQGPRGKTKRGPKKPKKSTEKFTEAAPAEDVWEV